MRGWQVGRQAGSYCTWAKFSPRLGLGGTSPPTPRCQPAVLCVSHLTKLKDPLRRRGRERGRGHQSPNSWRTWLQENTAVCVFLSSLVSPWHTAAYHQERVWWDSMVGSSECRVQGGSHRQSLLERSIPSPQGHMGGRTCDEAISKGGKGGRECPN